MICSPGRLAVSPGPIRFQTVEYLSSGRGKGRFDWADAPDSPEGQSVLLVLRSRLVQALADVELALGLLPPPSTVVPFPVFSASKPVALARLHAEYAVVVAVNPILVA